MSKHDHEVWSKLKYIDDRCENMESTRKTDSLLDLVLSNPHVVQMWQDVANSQECTGVTKTQRLYVLLSQDSGQIWRRRRVCKLN